MLMAVVIFLTGASVFHEIVLPLQIQKVNRLIEADDQVKLERYVKRNRLTIKSWPIVSSFFTAITDGTPMSSPLETACRENNEKAACTLLKYGANPNFVPFFQNKNYTPLTVAAANGNVELVRYLLESGANASAQGSRTVEAYLRYRMNCRKNGTPASEEDFYTLLQLLEKHSYVLPTQSDIGYTPMEYAALYGDTDAMQSLISEYSVDINDLSYEGQSVLHLCVISGWQAATPEIVEAILNMGVDPTVTDPNGKTAYDYAIEKGYEEIAPLLRYRTEDSGWFA